MRKTVFIIVKNHIKNLYFEPGLCYNNDVVIFY